MKLRLPRSSGGMTLVEVLMSTAAGGIILGAILTCGVALQRSFMAVENYSTAGGDQLRVLDYVAMDCRRAISATPKGLEGSLDGPPATIPAQPAPLIATGSWVNTGGTSQTDAKGVTTIIGGTGQWVANASGPTTLILCLPPYYDPTISYSPVNPTLDASKGLYYGTGIPDGHGGFLARIVVVYYQNGSNFIRRVVIQDATGNTTKDTITPIATNVATFTVTPQDLTSTLSCAITFKPKFTFVPTSGAVTGTTVYCNTFLRNAGARQ